MTINFFVIGNIVGGGGRDNLMNAVIYFNFYIRFMKKNILSITYQNLSACEIL